MKTLPAVRPPTNDTEERLLDVALTLFAEKGYDATSVREIIETTGVTRPVLYYYCSSKADLFQRLVHWKQEDAYRDLVRIARETTGCRNRLRAIVRGSFAFCAADPRLPRLMFQTHFGPAIPELTEFMDALGSLRFGILREVIQAGIENGELRAADPSALTLAFCCLMDQHINILCRSPDPRQHLTLEFADWLVELFEFGASVRPGN